MNQLAARRRRMGREVVLLDEDHREAAARSIPRDADAVDSASDDQQVDVYPFDNSLCRIAG